MVAMRRAANLLQEYSIPLLAGVVCALMGANLFPDAYAHFLHWTPFGHISVLGHTLDVHFLVNDIFMVFFFGVAAKEITESCLPGGSLNPPAKALNPLMATLGGVFGPIAVFFAGIWMFQATGIYGPEAAGMAQRGWGVPTATDIALAWLVARAVFGKGHPAIDFLLLLAIADDAIGLAIIAVFYGDPAMPARPEFLGLVGLGMAVAYGLRRANVKHWAPYIFGAGPIAWAGLLMAHLHPALTLVFIVPLLPGPDHDEGLFVDTDHGSPLESFEHSTKTFVDFGLFFFAFANAGVAMAGVGPMTLLILLSLVVGKTVGITACGVFADRIGFKMADGMTFRDLVMSAFIASLGLTVALFMSGAAFTDPALQAEAKMGALLSGFVGLVAVGIAKMGRKAQPAQPEVHQEAA